METTASPATLEKPASTRVPIHEPLASRWSPRAFDPTATLGREELVALFEAARWAPSSGNSQPWRYIAARRDEDAEAFARIVSTMTGANPRWAPNASLLVLTVARVVNETTGRPMRFATYDLGQASAMLVLEARLLGLAAHQMAGFDAAKAREAFAIPEGFEPFTLIAVGRQASPDVLPADLAEKERQERVRKPLEELVFGAWEEPASFL